MSRRNRVAAALLMLAAAVLPACGKHGNASIKANLGGSGLDELAELYKYRAQQGIPAPRSLKDLADNEAAALPTAYDKLQSGEYVLAWGAGYAAGSEAVLAYEKDAPQSGGRVLLQNGTVKEVSADEFKRLRKAG